MRGRSYSGLAHSRGFGRSPPVPLTGKTFGVDIYDGAVRKSRPIIDNELFFIERQITSSRITTEDNPEKCSNARSLVKNKSQRADIAVAA